LFISEVILFMKMKNFLTPLILILIFAFVGITVVYAAPNPFTGAIQKLDDSVGPTGLSQNLPATTATIIKALLALVGTIFLILTIYAGILWMTAQGESEKIEKAKGILIAAVIGLAITMAAYAITYYVTKSLSGI